jgi:hypothetical protein
MTALIKTGQVLSAMKQKPILFIQLPAANGINLS